MTSFMLMRDRLRKFIQSHEIAVTRIGHGLLMLLSLLAIASAFPFAPGLNRMWIMLPLSLAGVFMPLSAEALLVVFFLLLNLFSLSAALSGVTAIMFAVAYFFCAVYHSAMLHNVVGCVVGRELTVPFLLPVQSALLGSANEVVTILSGAILSFFLHEVHANANVFKEGDGQMSVAVFLQEKLVANQLFYVYLLAMITLFLVVYVIRTRSIDHAWHLAVLGGVSVEFLIMLAGYLLVGSRHSIPTLVIANLVTIAVGLVTSYLYQDLDYTRIEKVQFEDDEYYYYVTAVPKINLAEEKKEIKHIHTAERRGQ